MSEKSIILNRWNNSSTNKHQLTLKLPVPYESKNDEIALSSLFCYYSWFNITAAFGNNTFQYEFNNVTHTVTIPDGFYSILLLNQFLEFKMKQNGHCLFNSSGEPVYFLNVAANDVYYSCSLTATPIPSVLPVGWSNPNSITLSGNTPSLIFTSGFNKLLGFTAGSTVPASTQTTVYQKNSDFYPTITPINAINIECSWINNALWSTTPNTIFVFSPNTSFGAQIQISPSNPAFYECLSGQFSELRITFTSEDGTPLQIIDPNIIVQLLIRKKKKNP